MTPCTPGLRPLWGPQGRFAPAGRGMAAHQLVRQTAKGPSGFFPPGRKRAARLFARALPLTRGLRACGHAGALRACFLRGGCACASSPDGGRPSGFVPPGHGRRPGFAQGASPLTRGLRAYGHAGRYAPAGCGCACASSGLSLFFFLRQALFNNPKFA